MYDKLLIFQCKHYCDDQPSICYMAICVKASPVTMRRFMLRRSNVDFTQGRARMIVCDKRYAGVALSIYDRVYRNNGHTSMITQFKSYSYTHYRGKFCFICIPLFS